MNKKKKIAGKTTKSGTESARQDRGSQGSRALRLQIAQIRPYERNPRRSKNPEYDRIKASILMSGMDQALSVTQRPADTDYIVQAGGNTRLQILKELYDTTGEERFSRVDCWFVEWDRESTVLLAHLRENELRGNLTFIDKAQAVLDVKHLIAEERGVSAVSHRELEPFLTEHGYRLSHGLISLMDFAVSILAPLLPIALEAGLGKPQVERLRNLRRVARTVWSVRGAGTEAEYEAAFEALCRRHDSVDWHIEPLHQAIENEIAEAADISIQIIRMEFDCRLAGREPYIPDFVREERKQGEVFPLAQLTEPAIELKAERPSGTDTSQPGAQAESVLEGTADDALHAVGGADSRPTEVAIELPPEQDSEALFRRIGIQSKTPVPMELLRETAFMLAQRLAERHGMGTLIAPLGNNGLGFLVRDVPPASVVDHLDEGLLAEVSTMWWQLMTFAEMTAIPADMLQAKLHEASALSPAVLAGDGRCLSEQVRTVSPAQLAQRFWRQLNHDDWCDWLSLAHNYRELHRMARLTRTPLWSSTT